jgi:capsular exopolysaccharide synthesis family protein
MEQNAINLYREESPLINDAIDRTVVKVFKRKSVNDGKMILLIGCSPASGTTAISINLAIALSLAGRKTLLVDCDLRKSSKYKRLGDVSRFGLSDFLAGKVNKDDIIHNTNHKLLDYIACGEIQQSPVKLLCSADMVELAGFVKKEYEYIIVDTPPITVSPDADILFPVVDGIALVAGLGRTTKKQIWDTRRSIQGYPDKYYGLIINKVDLKQYGRYVTNYNYFLPGDMMRRYKYALKRAKKKIKGRRSQMDV